MEIGHIISELRKKRNISQKDLASDLNISSGLVGMWETNKRIPSLDLFVMIADYFNVSADELLKNDRSIDPALYTKIELPAQTEKLLDTFSRLDEDNRDILIGEAKKLLKSQVKSSPAPSLPETRRA